jgi:hypothetical protein
MINNLNDLDSLDDHSKLGLSAYLVVVKADGRDLEQNIAAAVNVSLAIGLVKHLTEYEDGIAKTGLNPRNEPLDFTDGVLALAVAAVGLAVLPMAENERQEYIKKITETFKKALNKVDEIMVTDDRSK